MWSVHLERQVLDNFPSSWRLALCEVKFFLTVENNDYSSALLWTIEKTTFANLNKFSNLLLLVTAIFFMN